MIPKELCSKFFFFSFSPNHFIWWSLVVPEKNQWRVHTIGRRAWLHNIGVHSRASWQERARMDGCWRTNTSKKTPKHTYTRMRDIWTGTHRTQTWGIYFGTLWWLVSMWRRYGTARSVGNDLSNSGKTRESGREPKETDDMTPDTLTLWFLVVLLYACLREWQMNARREKGDERKFHVEWNVPVGTFVPFWTAVGSGWTSRGGQGVLLRPDYKTLEARI